MIHVTRMNNRELFVLYNLLLLFLLLFLFKCSYECSWLFFFSIGHYTNRYILKKGSVNTCVNNIYMYIWMCVCAYSAVEQFYKDITPPKTLE
jgi:hypothetical protein